MNNTRSKKGNGAFGIVVLVLVILLLASCIGGFFLIRKSAGEIIDSAVSFASGIEEKPKQNDTLATEETPAVTPSPTATPTESDRKMPELDGAAPALAADSGNPIPTVLRVLHRLS